jgi:hypothetical protein
MSHIVAKPFNTRIHRLKVGDPVTKDHDLSPHTFDGLCERKFIAPVAPTPVSAASKRSSPPPARSSE